MLFFTSSPFSLIFYQFTIIADDFLIFIHTTELAVYIPILPISKKFGAPSLEEIMCNDRSIFLLCALKAYGTWACFAYHVMTLQAGNFKHAQLQNVNTLLERPFLELCNKLLLDSEECSVLSLGGAKHSTLLFLN